MTQIEIDGERRTFALSHEQLEMLAATDTPMAKYAQAILDHPDITVEPDQRDPQQ